MLNCFGNATKRKKAIPIIFVAKDYFGSWLKKQTPFIQNWLTTTQFPEEIGRVRLVPNSSGQLEKVICLVSTLKDFWAAGALPLSLPAGSYVFEMSSSDQLDKNFGSSEAYLNFAIAWGLGAYQFARYKKSIRLPAQLILSQSVDRQFIYNTVESIYLVRTLINMPTEDMGPSELAAATAHLAKQYKAQFKQLVGEQLLKNNFAAIYTVGRASDDVPRLLEMRWGNKKNPKITLVGKGVCFDTGGLDIKTASGMQLMKKDMGGAAHVLGLARMIMQAKLPVYLRVLIPAVENSVGGNAYRPGDIIKSHQGMTIEIGNTDAEGRVVLADALSAAVSEEPDLLIDMATLTGAARVALGTELPAVFSNQDKLVKEVISYANQLQDPIWHLPLFGLYRDSLNSAIADINNNSADPYGGAITAGLFLKEFVPDTIPWLHFDLMAWNTKARPGRPQGGEAMALRALFGYLRSCYGNRV
jgi:leucyl aminopeptidase